MDCIKSAVKNASEKIDGARKKDSLVFPVFTDLHTMDVDYTFAKKLISALKMITEEIDCDAVINLGDTFDMLGRQIHISNNELKMRFEQVFSKIYNETKLPLINVNGNHDAVGTDFFKADFWNSIVKGKYGNNMAVYGDEGSYYYIDCEKSDVRLVILSLPYDSDIESNMPYPLWKFGDKQLRWLDDEALNTKRCVLILSHVPFFYEYEGDREATLAVWNGEQEKVSLIADLCGGIEDRDKALEIQKKFAEKHILAGVLSGHTHFDLMLKPFETLNGIENPLSCHQVVTTSAFLGEGRQYGISIDIVVFSPSERRMDIFRIGDGEDRIINF